MNRQDAVGIGGFGALVLAGVVLLVAVHPGSTPAPSAYLGPQATWEAMPTDIPTEQASAQPSSSAAIPTISPSTLVSTGGTVFPEAQVLITSCVSHPGTAAVTADGLPSGTVGTLVTMSGTIRNTDTQADDYIVSFGTEAGDFGVGNGANLVVTNLAVGATRHWTDPGFVTNVLSQHVTCDALALMAEPA